jgi:Ser/Thr protein kinase RdoA (MazF antagonist)
MVAPRHADVSSEVARALAEYPQLEDPHWEPIPHGLINQSFLVRDGEREYVLQRVSAIFSPLIHENILAVTEHLRGKGEPSLRLLPTRAGRPYLDLGPHGRWRLETRVSGTSFEVCGSAEQARAAGALVARFHGALADLDHEFHPLGISLHDTAAYLAELERALASHRRHRLHGEVASLAREILSAARGWEPLSGVPVRVVHGDLKFNNVLFVGAQAVGLIDLDTVSRWPLWVELGDAWRSWCNRRGEDCAEAELDLGVLQAAVEGWLGEVSLELGPAERASLGHGLERMSLELAARFAADVLRDSYFGWDPERFPSRADHNLVRARGQLSLHRQAREVRGDLLRMLRD